MEIHYIVAELHLNSLSSIRVQTGLQTTYMYANKIHIALRCDVAESIAVV